MKETKTIKTQSKLKVQESSDDEMGLKPPHVSDEEMRQLIEEARQQESIDGEQSKKNVLRAPGL